MNNYEIKIIYKLSQKIKGERKIKKYLREIYNIEITLPNIKKVLVKIPDYGVNKKYSKLVKRKILYMYVNCKNTDKLIKYFNEKYNLNLNKSYLKKLACNKNMKKKKFNSTVKRNVSLSEELEIINLYNKGFSSLQIAKMYGYKGKKSILDILKSHNINRRKCSYNQENNKSYKDFSLKVLNSFEKAYFIGLLITDGYVNSNRNSIGLELTDLDAMEFLSKYINVKIVPIKPKKITHKEKYRLTLYGENYIEECKRFGITDCKTFTTDGCKLTPQENKYITYIIRGVIDGDGWIRKDGKEFFISSASKLFIEWCEQVLLNIGMNNIRPKFIKNESNGIYLIRTANKENIKILKEKIYDIPFGMSRKYDRLYERDVQRL